METKININSDFSEIVNYINPLFKIYIQAGKLSRHKDYSAISHWHEDLEFIYIISGTMDYNVNGDIITLTAGQGIMVNSRNLHYGYSEERNECEFICVLIHPTIMAGNEYIYSEYITPFTKCKTIPFIHFSSKCAWEQQLLNNLIDMYKSKADTPEFYLQTQQKCLQIFQLLYTNTKDLISSDTTKADTSLSQTRAMVNFIRENYASAITLQDIAKAGNLGKTACCNYFKKYMNTSPIEYLLSYRLSQSAILLRSSDLSITEIAYEVGFHNSSYYTKVFREYYGKPPKELRKEFL